jgi:hypothetical protein
MGMLRQFVRRERAVPSGTSRASAAPSEGEVELVHEHEPVR